jgi:hypothetical protein
MKPADKLKEGFWSALAFFAKVCAWIFAKMANMCEAMEIEATARATRYIR